jgi:hypothetical protein
MVEKLKLKMGKKNYTLRIHYVSLVVLVLVGLAAGYFLGHKGTTGAVVKDANCISQRDLEFFINQNNELREDYAGCVQEAWALQLNCKAQIDQLTRNASLS